MAGVGEVGELGRRIARIRASIERRVDAHKCMVAASKALTDLERSARSLDRRTVRALGGALYTVFQTLYLRLSDSSAPACAAHVAWGLGWPSKAAMWYFRAFARDPLVLDFLLHAILNLGVRHPRRAEAFVRRAWSRLPVDERTRWADLLYWKGVRTPGGAYQYRPVRPVRAADLPRVHSLIVMDAMLEITTEQIALVLKGQPRSARERFLGPGTFSPGAAEEIRAEMQRQAHAPKDAVQAASARVLSIIRRIESNAIAASWRRRKHERR